MQAERGSSAMDPKELREIHEMYLSPVFKVGCHWTEVTHSHSNEGIKLTPYQCPSLKVRLGDIDELLREAQIAGRRIDGERIEDIERQLEEDGYVSAEEADEDEVVAALSAAGEGKGAGLPLQAAKRGARLATLFGLFTHPQNCTACPPPEKL